MQFATDDSISGHAQFVRDALEAHARAGREIVQLPDAQSSSLGSSRPPSPCPVPHFRSSCWTGKETRGNSRLHSLKAGLVKQLVTGWA